MTAAETPGYLDFAEKSVAENWDEAERMRKCMERENGLLNAEQAATLLDISRARVSELLKLGQLNRYDFMGNIYLSAREVILRRQADIKAGRPKRKTLAALKTGLKVMVKMNKHQFRQGGISGNYPYSVPDEVFEPKKKKGRK